MDIKDLLKIIIAKEASDLHLSVGLPAMMRLNGTLEPINDYVLSHEEISDMLKSIFPPQKAAFLPDQEVDASVEIKNVARFRANVYYDKNGICAAFRFIPTLIRSIPELGLPDVVEQVCVMKRGLMLVTGIAGSGKSTTLAAIIDRINSTRHDHVITIEDPIEFVHNHKNCIVDQREIGTHTHSFDSALRAALREDPDVILVGELRDLETISMAITAAETGHLVLGTLHTRGAAQAIYRVIDIFPPHQQEQIRAQLSECLEMVVSQVLVPSVDGRHRYLACEVMVMTHAIRQLIRSNKIYQIQTEIETGSQWGMQSLEKSLKSLVTAGNISKETALQWVHDRKAFESF
ncbi:MAG TPA: type IV pili twitching motility protein PilT [Candidatus Omnitrophica bacterium]|nr:type IV pili twitching motility protein PilT [Candidatus Omnitrophota bacterium]